MWGAHDRDKDYNKVIILWDPDWFLYCKWWYDYHLYVVLSDFGHVFISTAFITYYIYFLPTNKFYHIEMQMLFYIFSFLLATKIYQYLRWYFTIHLILIPLITTPLLYSQLTYDFIVFYPKFHDNIKTLDHWRERIKYDEKIMEQRIYRSTQRKRRHNTLGNRFYNFLILPNEAHYDSWIAERRDLNEKYKPPKGFIIDENYNKEDFIVSKKERRHKFNAEWLWRHRPKPMFEAPDKVMYEYLENKGFNNIYQEPIFSDPHMSEAWLKRLKEIKKENNKK